MRRSVSLQVGKGMLLGEDRLGTAVLDPRRSGALHDDHLASAESIIRSR
jgi:hypothetical protein